MKARSTTSVWVSTLLLAFCLVISLMCLASLAEPTGGKDASPSKPAAPEVELTPKQLDLLRIEPIATRTFDIKSEVVGYVDFDQDKQVQVFTQFQGRILATFGRLGDAVKAGEVLYTIDSADLLQAEAMLIQTSGVLDLTKMTLTRARRLVPAGGGPQKDVDQATSDQQTAEGNFQAARNALLNLYGKTDADVDRIVRERKAESTLLVKSPIDGIISARNAAPGLFVQSGAAPAPYTVASNVDKWLNATVSEIDVAKIRIGDRIEASVYGLSGRVFQGTVTVLGASIDPATRRLTVRSQLSDPDGVLKPGMFATVAIQTAPARRALALPSTGVVREGDGAMTVWVTTDRRHFTQHIVQVGLQDNGIDEITSGLRQGELVVVDGAIFVSNMLNATPSD